MFHLDLKCLQRARSHGGSSEPTFLADINEVYAMHLLWCTLTLDWITTTCTAHFLCWWPHLVHGKHGLKLPVKEKSGDMENNLWRVGNLETSRDTIVKQRPIVHVCRSVNVRQINSCISAMKTTKLYAYSSISIHYNQTVTYTTTTTTSI